jgi:hypothetical protein
MPTAQVFGPFNEGRNWGQTKYCYLLDNSGAKRTHYIIRGAPWHSPVDVAWNGGAREVHCQVSANVQSISITHDNNICRNPDELATCGIVCTLFADAEGNDLIGTVMYGHLDDPSRLSEGLYTRASANFRDGGWVIAMVAPDCINCSCAKGVHVHMQVKAAANNTKSYVCSERIHRGTSLYTISF